MLHDYRIIDDSRYIFLYGSNIFLGCLETPGKNNGNTEERALNTNPHIHTCTQRNFTSLEQMGCSHSRMLLKGAFKWDYKQFAGIHF